MKSDASDRKVFRGILRAIASEEFSREDYRSALTDLRSGKLVSVLETVMQVLSGEAPAKSDTPERKAEHRAPLAKGRSSKAARRADQVSPDQMFDDTRRRKLTRSAVEEYIASLDRSFAHQFAHYDTLRSLLHAFRDRSDLRSWELLYSWVNGDYERDPYMQRIVAG